MTSKKFGRMGIRVWVWSLKFRGLEFRGLGVDLTLRVQVPNKWILGTKNLFDCGINGLTPNALSSGTVPV